jgi:predicted small secreted protein
MQNNSTPTTQLATAGLAYGALSGATSSMLMVVPGVMLLTPVAPETKAPFIIGTFIGYATGAYVNSLITVVLKGIATTTASVIMAHPYATFVVATGSYILYQTKYAGASSLEKYTPGGLDLSGENSLTIEYTDNF